MSHLKLLYLRLKRNILDSDRSVILAMTSRPAILLLSLFLENTNLFSPIMLQDRGFHLGVCQQWGTRLKFAVVLDKQNFAQVNRRARVARQSFQPDRLSRRHSILFAARFDHGVHSGVLLNKDKRSF